MANEITGEKILITGPTSQVGFPIARALARHNQVAFVRDGVRYTVAVPDQVDLKVEVELGESNEIEVELTW